MISMIRFEHGEKTCSTEAGVSCLWKGYRRFGIVEGCALFSVELSTEDGLTLRCSECVDRFGTGDIDEDLRQECQAEG